VTAAAPDVHRDRRRQGGDRVAVQPYVDQVGDLEPARGQQRVPAPELLAVDAAQVQGDPCDGGHGRDGFPERLHPAYAHGPAGTGQLQLVAEAGLARAERAGDHRAAAPDGERPVDPKPYRCRRVGRR